MTMLLSLFVCSVLVLTAHGASVSGNSVLVLLDDMSLKDTHSQFFGSLKGRGFELDYQVAESSEVAIQKYGEYLYDHLIIFAPAAEEFGGSVTVDDVIGFIDSGRNVLIATDSGISESIRDIASECGVEFDEDQTYAIDHFNYDQSDYDGQHTLIVADEFINNPLILGEKKINPVLFSGIAHEAESSELLYNVLGGSSTSYSALPSNSEETPFLTGKKTGLVTALQARNNARVVFSGSLNLFSNKFFNAKVETFSGKKFEKSGNEHFCEEVLKWNFQERGILRSHSVDHKKNNVAVQPAVYTIEESVSFSVVIEEWNGVDSKWVPYNGKDVQLEFRMLDPYVRTTLQNKGGKFSTSFVLPDVYGIFTFRVDYHRPGYTPVHVVDRVTVRPLTHDQYERFIESAYPYYASAFSMLVGLSIFSLVFLYNKDKN